MSSKLIYSFTDLNRHWQHYVSKIRLKNKSTIKSSCELRDDDGFSYIFFNKYTNNNNKTVGKMTAQYVDHHYTYIMSDSQSEVKAVGRHNQFGVEYITELMAITQLTNKPD